MSDKINTNVSKSVNEARRSNSSEDRSVSKKSTGQTASSLVNANEGLQKYQFYSLHEELTFLRNERVNFQHRSQLQYAEIKRLKQELKAKVHELWDCKEKLKAYEIEEQIKESNSANNGNNNITLNSKNKAKGKNEIINYCVTKSEKIPSAENIDVKREKDESSQCNEVLEQKESEQVNGDVLDNNNNSSGSKRSYGNASHADNKVINELRRNLAQRDSALHDMQLRSIELDTARGKLARDVERTQHELMNVSEERNTLNNKLLNKDREIDRLNKELCASQEQVNERTREVERLLVRNKTYELLLHDKDDLCFAVGNTANENELQETTQSRQESEHYYDNYCKVFNHSPTTLYAKRLPSQYNNCSSSNNNNDTCTEESKIIHSVLHSQSLMFKQRIREIQMELTKAKEREERLQHEMLSKQNEIEQCNKEVMELREECKRVRDECVFHKEEVALLQNKIETMNTENSNNNNVKNDDNYKNTNTAQESYVALMKLNRRLQRKVDKMQTVKLHDSETHIDNLKNKNENDSISHQVDEWKSKCTALQRTNDELQSDNRILAHAAELLCASRSQKSYTLSEPSLESTVELQHNLQVAQQAVADLQEKLNIVTRENVEYEMLITKIADMVPVQALLCKENEVKL